MNLQCPDCICAYPIEALHVAVELFGRVDAGESCVWGEVERRADAVFAVGEHGGGAMEEGGVVGVLPGSMDLFVGW